MAQDSDSAAIAESAQLGALLDSDALETLREVGRTAGYWPEIARSASADAASAERNFHLNEEEQKRLEIAQRTMVRDPMYWARLAVATHQFILQAYIDRDLTFRELIEVTNSTALGCSAAHRVTMLGIAAATARDAVRKRPRNRRAPQYPLALKHVAVVIVIELKEQMAWLPLNSEKGDSVLARAVEWIRAAGFFAKPPSRKTLHEWYVARLRELGTAAPRGRPRKG
jgi:hypothetical protein